MDKLARGILLHRLKVLIQFRHKDTVAVLQAHVIKISLALVEEDKGIDLFPPGRELCDLLLPEWAQRTVTLGKGDLLIGRVSHKVFIFHLEHLRSPEACRAKSIPALQGQPPGSPTRTFPVLQVLRLIDEESVGRRSAIKIIGVLVSEDGRIGQQDISDRRTF